MAEISDLSTTDASNTARFPEGMDPAAVNDGARALEGLVARWYGDTNASLASTGSSNAYALSINSTDTIYDGQVLAFEANHSNTGAATLNVTNSGGSAQGAKALRKNYNAALASGDIVAGQKVVVVYDAAEDFFQMLSPASSSASAASTSAAGIVELATTAETTTGTDATRAVTPDGLHDMTSLSGAAWFLDEDDFSSNSATKVPSQQSTKAYVDASVKAWTYESASTSTGAAFVAFSGIPTGIEELEFIADGLSWSGTQAYGIQLGDATTGGYITTGYSGYHQQATAAANANSTNFIIQSPGVAATVYNITARFMKLTSASHIWAIESSLVASAQSGVKAGTNGVVTLAGALDRIKIFASSDTVDANAGVYVRYR